MQRAPLRNFRELFHPLQTITAVTSVGTSSGNLGVSHIRAGHVLIAQRKVY